MKTMENMMNNLNKVILTDCDGVLLNWEYAFNTWMKRHGYTMKEDGHLHYDMGDRYGLTSQRKTELIKFFNESSAIGFLPPLRDAMYYVDLLHRKHGYVFHMITSLSLEPSAQQLRIENTKKLFGETAFEKFVFCDTGADKDEALSPYMNSGYMWIEDKVENAVLGLEYGLNSVIMEHGHNMHFDDPTIPRVQNWKEIYDSLV
jgi:hypothetical protein